MCCMSDVVEVKVKRFLLLLVLLCGVAFGQDFSLCRWSYEYGRTQEDLILVVGDETYIPCRLWVYALLDKDIDAEINRAASSIEFLVGDVELGLMNDTYHKAVRERFPNIERVKVFSVFMSDRTYLVVSAYADGDFVHIIYN